MKPTSTVVEAARECPLLTKAHALAAFVGGGRPVTAKAVHMRPALRGTHWSCWRAAMA